jgi:16S rRNA (cytidine1402-2'-O)-methyltransferase
MLYIVPTPIGNLEDITIRAINVLKSVDYILAEDTRTSKKLLQHYAIETSLRSHHAHNEHATVKNIVLQIQGGAKVALISDAGTPGISDPGFLLIRECVRNGVQIVSLPGATAFVPALVASGLPCDAFHYEGFLPHKKGRQTRFKYLATLDHTFVLYESPHRLVKCLEELALYCGATRQACVCREISKIYEDFQRGTVSDLALYFGKGEGVAKGEIAIVVAGKDEPVKRNMKEED